MKRLAVTLVLVTVASLACKSLTSGVKWEPKANAPELGSRGDGCYVEIFELGNEPERPYQVVGVLTLELTNPQVKNGQGANISERFKGAACEYGVFMVKDIKAMPDPTSGRVLYEAKAAVFLDDDGKPIMQTDHEDKKTAADAAETAAAGASEATEAVTGSAGDGAPAANAPDGGSSE